MVSRGLYRAAVTIRMPSNHIHDHPCPNHQLSSWVPFEDGVWLISTLCFPVVSAHEWLDVIKPQNKHSFFLLKLKFTFFLHIQYVMARVNLCLLSLTWLLLLLHLLLTKTSFFYSWKHSAKFCCWRSEHRTTCTNLFFIIDRECQHNNLCWVILYHLLN